VQGARRCAIMSLVPLTQEAAAAQCRPISICTIGDLVLDVVVRPEHALAPDGDTPAAIRLGAGGQAANVAAWASVLGASSRVICKRGTDAASTLAAAELARFGVEISGPVAAGRGGVVVSLLDTSRRRTMASDRGVASLLEAPEVDPSWLQGCDVLHVSGYCLFQATSAQAAVRAARLVPRVTVDLASAHDIDAIGAQLFVARLQELRPAVVFATEAERGAVPDLDAAWVIKLGGHGASFPEGVFAARPVTAVDTTGAGDALAAGYLVGGPELAMEAAARCVRLVGAMPQDSGVAGDAA
jgi:ribokinase